MAGLFISSTFISLLTTTLVTLGDSCWFGSSPECVYQCHCQWGTCDRDTGVCSSGCSDGVDGSRYQGPWSGYGCQLGNQAYGKAADQGPGDWDHNVATRAVDGFLNPDIRAGYCAHPIGDDGNPAWWEVDLGDDYVVVSVNITNRDRQRDRLTSTAIEVSADRVQYTYCTTLGSDIGEPVFIHVDCDTVQVGRYVRIRRFPGANEAHAMSFCEVQVYAYQYEVLVCPYGYFGIACSSRCDDCPGDCEEDVTGACLTSTPVTPADFTTPTTSGITSTTTQPTELPQPSGAPIETVSTLATHPQTPTLTYYSSTPTDFLTRTTLNITSTTTQPTELPQPSGAPIETGGGSAGLSTGATAGIAISVLCILAIIVLGLILCRRRDVRQKLRNHMQAVILCGNGGKGSENEGYENPIASAHASSTPSSPPIDGTRLTARGTETARNTASDAPGAASLETEDGEFQDHHYESLDSLSDKDTEGAEAHVYTNVAVTSRPVRVAELAAYIEDLETRSSGFQDEFTGIPTGGRALCFDGLSPVNKSKNRYNSECAYDHSRVVLTINGGGKNETDYINASYINSYKDIERGNIAAQGPKASTVVDMWRLVWQTGANRIIMITKAVDNGWENCEQYWPNIGTKEYGLFIVTLTNIEKFADHVIRLLNVEYNEQSRAVHHFQFTSWPDKDVPKMASSLLDFHRKIRVLDYVARGPQIVHCSSGSGATGTFLAIDYLLQEAKNEGVVDVQRYTSLMRSSRINMIETLAQYVFMYHALLEALLCEDMAVADQDFAEGLLGLATITPGSYKSIFLEQFELLEKLQTKTGDVERYTGREEQNLDKNRTTDLVPCNQVRPVLTLAIDGTTDYINATYVSGYRHHHAYLVTQLPLPNTVCDVWRLIHDHKVNTIVLMHAIVEDDESTPVYWPHIVGHPFTFGPLTIRLVMEEELGQGACIAREFVVTNKRKNKNQHQSVRQFELRGWPESAEVPANTRELLATMNQVSLWQKRSGIRPIIAQCRYGAHHSGLYVAASHMLERLRIDRQVDVFHAVKHVRAGRAELVPSHEQYTYLHYFAKDYLRNAKPYANME